MRPPYDRSRPDNLPTADPPAPARSDARRNRAAIVAAAGEVIAEEGLDAPTQLIAQRAGVGVGTLFRHFPTKDALVDEVGMVQLRTIIDRFGEALREPDPGSAFERLIWHFTGQHVHYRAVPRTLQNDTSPEVDSLRGQLYELLSRAVRLAQDAGRIRADLELADIMLLMTACAHIADGTSGADPALRKRFMVVVFDGMRPELGTDLPRLTRPAHVDSWLGVYQAQHPESARRPGSRPPGRGRAAPL